MSNVNFTGISNVTVGQFTSVTSQAVQTVSLNAVNIPKVGSTLIAVLPKSFYNAPFATGSVTAPLLMVDLAGNYVALPLGSQFNYFTGISINFAGFGPGGTGVFNAANFIYLGTCSKTLTNISFNSINSGNTPLTGGQIQINAAVSTISNCFAFDANAGVSTTGGTGATALTNSVPGWSILGSLTSPGVAVGNNYLCTYFPALGTATTTNAVGSFSVYISYINSVPTLS